MRTKLSDRKLPDYTRGEEIFNMASHTVGGAFAILALLLCMVKSARAGSGYGLVSSALYGGCMLLLYCMSSIYHGLLPSMGKKVMQVLDHCAIYFMIAGTYMPIALCAIRPLSPGLGWAVFGLEWGLAALAVTFNAIDFKRYRVLAMVCNILMGWLVVFFLPATVEALGRAGFRLLLLGGLSYTLGAVLYGIGAKKRYFHCAFHLFVLLGSVLQFFSIYLYVL